MQQKTFRCLKSPCISAEKLWAEFCLNVQFVSSTKRYDEEYSFAFSDQLMKYMHLCIIEQPWNFLAKSFEAVKDFWIWEPKFSVDPVDIYD